MTSFLPFLESFSLQVLLLLIHNIKFTPSFFSGSDSPCTNSKLILITHHPHPFLSQTYLFMSPKRYKSRPIYLPSQNSFANFSILYKYRRRRKPSSESSPIDFLNTELITIILLCTTLSHPNNYHLSSTE